MQPCCNLHAYLDTPFNTEAVKWALLSPTQGLHPQQSWSVQSVMGEHKTWVTLIWHYIHEMKIKVRTVHLTKGKISEFIGWKSYPGNSLKYWWMGGTWNFEAWQARGSRVISRRKWKEFVNWLWENGRDNKDMTAIKNTIFSQRSLCCEVRWLFILKSQNVGGIERLVILILPTFVIKYYLFIR